MILCILVALPLVVGALLSRIEKPALLWRLSLSTVVALLFLSLSWFDTAITLPLFGALGISFQYTAMATLYVPLSLALWLVAVLASRHQLRSPRHQNRYYTALMVTLGGVLGIFLASDLFTLFVFFEVMSFSSYLWVMHNQDEDALKAGSSYLTYGVCGGLALLMGIFLLYGLVPDLTIANLTDNFAPYVGTAQLTAACALLFLGFGAKAGAFFLHDWLPLSYVAAPAPTSALLSGILSKAGVYGILLITVKILPHWQPFAYFLLGIALLNMVVGGLCALGTANLKRMLAFSSISQIGFILWGLALLSLLGEEGSIAAYGTLFHMVNHTLIKVLLFCLAGLVYGATHTLDLNQLRGFGRGKPWLHGLFLIGMAAVSGIPGLSGYLSKTLLHESIVEYLLLYGGTTLLQLSEGLFLFAGGCTLAYMLKLYVCLFWEGDTPSISSWGDFPTKGTLSLIALSLVVLGLLPHLTFDLLGDAVAPFLGVLPMERIAYFSLENLSGSLISIAIGIALFFAQRTLSRLRGGAQYRERLGASFTLAHLVYAPLVSVLSFLGSLVARICDVALDTLIFVLSRTAFVPLSIPQTFFQGEDLSTRPRRTKLHISFTLSYSLLMFGMGFLFTIVSLLLLGELW